MAHILCSHKKCFFFLGFILLMATRVSLQTCSPGLRTIGYTYPPGDIVLEYGKSVLNITCVVNKSEEDSVLNLRSGHPSDYLYFQASNMNVTENVEIINETSIRLYMENLNTSSVTYTCLYDKETVCVNQVVVGTAPLPVTDFQCISLNYDNLTCTWTLPNNYVLTKYHLAYMFGGRAARLNISPCPEIRDVAGDVPKKSCFWNLTTIPMYRHSQPVYNFNLTSENSFGTNILSYTFDHFKFVKPGPPENLSALNATTSSIFLSWNIPISMRAFPEKLNYRVLYQCEFSPKDWKLAGVMNIPSPSSQPVYFHLTGLEHAHDLCDIRVALKSNKTDDEFMWSSNASVTYRTSSDIPGAPPRTNIGSFELIHLTPNNGTRGVIIYWQQIREEIKNGGDFEYKVRVMGDSSEVLLKEQTNTYAKFINLWNHKEYLFEIWSQNSEGPSKMRSYVRVPAKENYTKEPLNFKKYAYSEHYKLIWQPPDKLVRSNLKNYTLFWCKDSSQRERPYQCNGNLNWKEVPGDISEFIVNSTDSNSINQFAISANSEKYSSGMVWAACTVLPNKPIGKPRDVQRLSYSPDSMQLSWKFDCVDPVTNIAGYVIYYCRIEGPTRSDCHGPEQNVTIKGDVSTTHGVVKNLKPYTTYRFTVAVLTKRGETSDATESVFGTTLEGKPSIPLDLHTVNVTNSTIKIEWRAPSIHNGRVKFYHIHLIRNEYIFDTKNVTSNEKFTQYQYLLENLTSYTNYTIYVTACTTDCSEPSNHLSVETKMGRPSVISQPTISFQNNSFILVVWNKPEKPNGRNDLYQVHINEKRLSEGVELAMLNVTERSYAITTCEESMNTLYIRVRAINIIPETNEHMLGPWSPELECYCSKSINLGLYFIIFFAAIFVVLLGVLSKRLFERYKLMKDVQIKLPDNLSSHEFVPPKLYEPKIADQQYLLTKTKNNTGSVGDSSGCSSGHSSVASDTATSASSTSDSGTEQNELRKRSRNSANLTPSRMPGNTSYVTMPLEALNKPRVKTAGNYCVLGVDPVVNSEGDTYNSDSMKSSETGSTPYVLSGDLNKATNSGYVPLSYPDLAEKNPAYVMAGIKSSPEFIKAKEEKPLYVQVADGGTKSIADTMPCQPLVENLTKGYVSIGEAALPLNKRVESSNKAYVPHRHFDTKLFKED